MPQKGVLRKQNLFFLNSSFVHFRIFFYSFRSSRLVFIDKTDRPPRKHGKPKRTVDKLYKQGRLTRRQRLLDLVGLVRVLEFEGVEEALSAELELDVLALCGFLQAGTYSHSPSLARSSFHFSFPDSFISWC